MENENLKKGILFLVFSAFSFALMGMFVRLAGDIPFMQKAFFRNLVSFAIAFFSLAKEEKTARLQNSKSVFKISGKEFLFLLLRASCGSIGIFGNFYALDHLNIADAAMLNKMSPFFTLLFCFFLLGEKVELIPLLAVSTAFAGSLLIIKPSFNLTHFIPSLAGFFSGMGAGFAYACVRKLHSYNTSPSLIITFFSLFSCLISVPFILINPVPMTLKQFLILLGAGLAAAGGQFGITFAYYNAPASKISIFDYSQIIFSAILGFIAFHQIPDIFSFLGYVIIISMAAVVFFYNKRNSRT